MIGTTDASRIAHTVRQIAETAAEVNDAVDPVAIAKGNEALDALENQLAAELAAAPVER
jgi:hypothetical protein